MSAKRSEKQSTIRSMRLNTITMDRARAIAEDEGTTLNAVVNRLLEGYNMGQFVLEPLPEKQGVNRG